MAGKYQLGQDSQRTVPLQPGEYCQRLVALDDEVEGKPKDIDDEEELYCWEEEADREGIGFNDKQEADEDKGNKEESIGSQRRRQAAPKLPGYWDIKVTTDARHLWTELVSQSTQGVYAFTETTAMSTLSEGTKDAQDLAFQIAEDYFCLQRKGRKVESASYMGQNNR
ncbi:hypothetical protein FA15DRAFT_709201 [Coprinopsis marcescibilis]|uniref:Uncharacterized protein n=1 Tax=Coprinopsis marcescibilis TaxID=230819 RepID=A0A5C3KGA6_COPMA|nr:hypothetical protein FA15DRAFT_709201 [Coprinopsis marcescibilis]